MKPNPYEAPNRLRLVKTVGVLICLLVIYGVYLSRTNSSSFETWYIGNNGPVLWLSLIGLLSASFICFYRILVLRPFRSRLFLVGLFGQGLLFLLGAGEKLSWGQGLLRTELSLGSSDQLLFGAILGILIGCYFILLPIIYKKVPNVKYWVNDLALPLPHLAHLGLYVAIFLITRLVEGNGGGDLLAFAGVWIFVMMVLVPYNSDVFSRRLINR